MLATPLPASRLTQTHQARTHRAAHPSVGPSNTATCGEPQPTRLQTAPEDQPHFPSLFSLVEVRKSLSCPFQLTLDFISTQTSMQNHTSMKIVHSNYFWSLKRAVSSVSRLNPQCWLSLYSQSKCNSVLLRNADPAAACILTTQNTTTNKSAPLHHWAYAASCLASNPPKPLLLLAQVLSTNQTPPTISPQPQSLIE